MKIIALLAIALAATACQPLAPTAYNPLDTPGAQPTAAELHAKNLSAITGNPAYR